MTLRARNTVLRAKVSLLITGLAITTLWALMATVGWMYAPSKMDINLRPVLPNRNVVLSGDGVDPVAAFQFAAFVMQNLYLWKSDGFTEYRTNLMDARRNRLISHKYYSDLRLDFINRAGQGNGSNLNTLLHRHRSDLVNKEFFYNQTLVFPEKDYFIVTLVMDSLETLNDTPVRNVKMQYTLQVGRSADSDSNEYNMQILGNHLPPKRLN
jgi:hypothetical protein